MNVLGIESSCDETAAAVVGAGGDGEPCRVLSDRIYSQAIHVRYGGVVPELASRSHMEQIVPVVRAALDEAGITRPDAIAVTSGPGLIGAVLVGLCFARAAALGWGVPMLGVNHLEGHLLSPLLETPRPSFPFLALLISGGHTSLYLAEDIGVYHLLGETVDDAVGECFDKAARVLGLPYPGGPGVDRLATEGDPTAIPLPRSRVVPNDLPGPALAGDLGMSFSGLKSAVRRAVELQPSLSRADLAASFQAAIADTLIDRLQRAAAATGVRQVAVSGGVAANALLRRRLPESGLEVFFPPRHRCTDNAAMIAFAGRLRLLRGEASPLSLTARPRWAPGAP